MVREGLLLEEAVEGDRRGRRGVLVQLNPNFGQLVGLDIEGKRFRMVATNFAGEILWERRHPLKPPKSRQRLIEEITTFVDESMAEIRSRFQRPIGFGLAAGGVVDVKRGQIVHYDMLPFAVELPLRDMIAERVQLPCVMENNIRAMTLAEWVNGAGKGMNTFICVAVRSGVAAGLIMNGRLRTGKHGLCGEIGYMVLPTDKDSSNWKRLQEMVSESALGIDIDTDHSQLSESTARWCGELLGSQLASLAAVVDPEAMVLAGGMLQPLGPIWPHVIRTFREHALPELAEHVRVLPAQLGPFAAALGAAHRVLYEIFPMTMAPA
ncbi:MAG TPA: ROK family protein [Tepidisphaeraceae bacterium]|nr:ROK family protein [Tepidisphaeraceae bacterium]